MSGAGGGGGEEALGGPRPVPGRTVRNKGGVCKREVRWLRDRPNLSLICPTLSPGLGQQVCWGGLPTIPPRTAGGHRLHDEYA